MESLQYMLFMQRELVIDGHYDVRNMLPMHTGAEYLFDQGFIIFIQADESKPIVFEMPLCLARAAHDIILLLILANRSVAFWKFSIGHEL